MTGKFKGCIVAAVDAGEVDKDLAAELQETYDDAFAAAGETLSPGEADRHAGQIVVDSLARAALEARRQKALAVRARRAALESAAAYKTARGYTGVKALGGGGARPPKGGWSQGGTPPAKGPHATGGIMADWLKELVDGEGGLAGAAGPSIKGRYQAILGSLQAKMAGLMDQFEEVSGTGTRGRALLDHVVAEAFGEDTGDAAAKGLAKAWGETADHARKLFNAAGGDIPKLASWGLPQAHDALSVRAAGREGWVEAILPALDAGRMIDRVTGLPFTPKRLRAVLGDVWETIVSHGAVDREVGESLGSGKLASRRADHRFLVFKDAAAWTSYQRDFGIADPYVAMMRHLDSMARDVAQMQVLGPNPSHQFKWLADTALRDAAVEQAEGAAPQRGIKQAEGDVDSARRMYGLFTGELASPYGADNTVARVGGSVRALLSGVQLGSAVINDVVSNPVMAAQVRSFVGLSKLGEFRPWLEHVFTVTGRQTARRSGFILESARVRHGEAVQRFLRADTVGAKVFDGANAFARMLPTWVHRASALEPNRNAQRWAFQHEFMGRLFDLREKSLADLSSSSDASETAFAAIVRARGFSDAQWDQVRASPPDSPEAGVDFISPQAVARAHGDEMGWLVAEMIERETRQAVPEPSLWGQAQLTGHTRPGTIMGEVTRSLAAYRSFTVTQTYRWAREFMQRGLEGAEDSRVPWHLRAAGMAAPMLVGATLSGFLAIWLKDIVKGNDPRPLWDEDPEKAWPRLWKVTAQAMAQGGGQGILGDFFTSVEARNGKGAAATSLGAPANFVSDIWQLTGGNVGEALDGKDTHGGKEATKFLARYSPLSSLWWSRATWDRAVTDQLQRMVDPEAAADFQRAARRMERESGQKQWWPEGQPVPERAPDLAAVVGQ